MSGRHGESGAGIAKARTGIAGLDEITFGGLPHGRPTIVCGGPGCGKTLLATEFLVRGATQFDEPGVFLSFEETSEEITENVRSLGFDLDALVAENRLSIDYVHFEPSEIEQTGEFDLEGLFLRLGFAIDSIGARRVVLDTLETLFGGLDGPILRAELRRLFRWLKDRDITCVITAERGEGALTRHGLEEYVSDCVILLEHSVRNHVSTRRLRVVKYRGTTHGTNEYPFLIDRQGLSILPITSLSLDHPVSNDRISSGVPKLDEMLGGQGYYRGSSILLSGTAGTGKSSVAAHFADATCRRGERCLYLSFEESEAQFVRNMRSIGLDLGHWIDEGLLHYHASRPALYGLEMHLAAIHALVDRVQPDGGRHRSRQQLRGPRFRRRAAVDGFAAGRFPEVSADHGAPRESHEGRRAPRNHPNRRLVGHRHVAAAARHRVGRRAQQGHVRPEIARHAAFEPDSRIRDHPEGYRPHRCLYRPSGGAHRISAHRAGSARSRRSRVARAGDRATPTRAGTTPRRARKHRSRR